MTPVTGRAIDPNIVLTALREHEYTPVELLAKLEKDENVPDALVKDIVGQLLQQGSILLSSEHTLKIAEPSPEHRSGAEDDKA